MKSFRTMYYVLFLLSYPLFLAVLFVTVPYPDPIFVKPLPNVIFALITLFWLTRGFPILIKLLTLLMPPKSK